VSGPDLILKLKLPSTVLLEARVNTRLNVLPSMPETAVVPEIFKIQEAADAIGTFMGKFDEVKFTVSICMSIP
jgi:hypothetical protein